MSQNHIRLDDLLSRTLAVDWFESVALIQAACRTLGEGVNGFPDPADIVLRADGTVVVLRVPTGGDGAPSAARLLAQMAHDTSPVQLRLLVSQTTAAHEGSSLAEFSRALAFFERPDAPEILRQLYARASAAAARPADAWEAFPPESTSPAKPAVTPPAETRKPGRRRFGALAVGAALVIGIVGAGAFLGFGKHRQRTFAAIESVQTMVQQKLGLTPADAAGLPVENVSEKPPTVSKTTQSRSTKALVARPVADRLFSRYQLTMLPPREPAALELPMLMPRVDETIRIGFASAESVAEPRAPRVYSAADADVTPPRAVYPQFPPAPPMSQRDGHTVIDLLIAEDGSVEKAQLRSLPRNVIEIMLLSAAKAWRFQPARVDGLPVRFHHHVVVTPEIAGGRLF